MSKLKLRGVENRLIANLSKGYRQRVGLAQAIMGFPDIIILDEPMVGLDPQQIIEIRQLIRSLAKNHTVILSFHILGEVRELCDYILIIAGGRLVAQDTPDNLQKLLCREEILELEAKGSAEQIREILSGVKNIQKSLMRQKEEDVCGIKLWPEQGKDLRENLFFAFAEAGCPLISMYENKGTLEDVYLKLTQEGGRAIESNIQKGA